MYPYPEDKFVPCDACGARITDGDSSYEVAGQILCVQCNEIYEADVAEQEALDEAEKAEQEEFE